MRSLGSSAARGSLALVLLGSLGFVPSTARAATLPGTNGLIVTMSQFVVGGPLVAIDPASGTRTTLNGSVAGDGFPKISPNGTRVAFSNPLTGVQNVFVADFPSGNNRTQVTTSGGNFFPAWAPDSNTLVFNCAAGLCTASAVANAPVTTLTGSLTTDTTPEFDPTGQFVVFRATAAPAGIARLNANNSGSRTNLNGTMAGDRFPQVAPDGSKVWFDDAAGAGTGIFSVSWPNGGLRAQLTGSIAGDLVPIPSPDGTKIALSNNGDALGLQILNANGTGGRASLVNSGATDSGGSWGIATGGVVVNPAPVFSAASACGGAAMLRLLPLFGPATAGVSASDTAGQTVTLSASINTGYVQFTSVPGNPATGTLAIVIGPLEFLNLIVAVLGQTPTNVSITATDNGTPVASSTCVMTVRVGIV